MTDNPFMSQLLVSVRNASEALLAHQAGADLIDVKEPARGSLGFAGSEIIVQVLDRLNGVKPVSAALGEWLEETPSPVDPRLAYTKRGLAGADGNHRWRHALGQELASANGPKPVIVAYADWQCAQAPPIEEVVHFACSRRGNVLLIDTHCKEPSTSSGRKRPTLLDWLSSGWLAETCQRCREFGVRIALAGSLGFEEIALLRSAAPDWFAVRGAVCAARDRLAELSPERIQALIGLLKDQASKNES
jgi:uncharacterized protein (UPF0264 family)